MRLKYGVGDTVLCKFSGIYYDAKIISVNSSKSAVPYKVHYVGWNDRWDEWVGDQKLMDKYGRIPSKSKERDKEKRDKKDTSSIISSPKAVASSRISKKDEHEKSCSVEIPKSISPTPHSSISAKSKPKSSLFAKVKALALDESRRRNNPSSSKIKSPSGRSSRPASRAIARQFAPYIPQNMVKENSKEVKPVKDDSIKKQTLELKVPIPVQPSSYFHEDIQITQSGRLVRPVERKSIILSSPLPTTKTKTKKRAKSPNKTKYKASKPKIAPKNSTVFPGGGLRTNRNTPIVLLAANSEKQSPKQSDVEYPSRGTGFSSPKIVPFSSPEYPSPTRVRKRKRTFSNSSLAESIALDFGSQDEGTEVEDTHPETMISPTSAMLSIACSLNGSVDGLAERLESVVDELRSAEKKSREEKEVRRRSLDSLTQCSPALPYSLPETFHSPSSSFLTNKEIGPGPAHSSLSCDSIESKIEEFSLDGTSFFDPSLEPPDLGSEELFDDNWWSDISNYDNSGEFDSTANQDARIFTGPTGPSEAEFKEVILASPGAEEVINPPLSRPKKMTLEKSIPLPLIHPKPQQTYDEQQPIRSRDHDFIRVLNAPPPPMRAGAKLLNEGDIHQEMSSSFHHSSMNATIQGTRQQNNRIRISNSRYHDSRPLPAYVLPKEHINVNLDPNDPFVEIPATIYADHCYGKISPAQRELRREQQAQIESQTAPLLADESGRPMFLQPYYQNTPENAMYLRAEQRRKPQKRPLHNLTSASRPSHNSAQTILMMSTQQPKFVRLQPHQPVRVQNGHFIPRQRMQQVYVVENSAPQFRPARNVYGNLPQLPRIIRNARLRPVGQII